MGTGLLGRRPRRLALPLLVSIALTLAFAGTASAADVVVNDDTAGPGPAGADCSAPDFSSIQAAHNDAGTTNGDRLLVCAGTYSNGGAGPVAAISKQVSVIGAQEGVDARDRSVAASAETVLDDTGGGLSISASNVTVDGLTVTGNTENFLGAGVHFGGTTDNQTFENNIVSDNIIGLYLNGANADAGEDAVVRHNLFDSNDNSGSAGGSGIYSDQGLRNAVVEQNEFTGQPTAAFNAASASSSNLAFRDNVLADDTSIVAFSVNGLEVTGNESTDIFGSGIFLGGSNNAVTISGNDLDDTGPDQGGGVKNSSLVSVSNFTGTPNTNVEISDNLLTNGARGVNVGDAGADNTLAINENRIAGNTVAGVRNQSTSGLAVNAENNWWGCSGGPGGTGCDAAVNTGNGSIDSNPRLVLALSASPTQIQTGGQTSQVTADLTKNSAGQAVTTDLFDGDEIAFGTNLGSVQSPRTVANQVATTTLTSGANAGTANVTASLDGGTDTVQVAITSPPADPDPGDPAPGEPLPGPIGPSDADDDIVGTDGADVLSGLGGEDTILGGLGDDVLKGGDAADLLDGGNGDDELGGGNGADQVDGGEGDDTIRGGPGQDVLDGGPGKDDVAGNRGQDEITADDGEKDTIDCGANVDTVDADNKDDVNRNCENVS